MSAIELTLPIVISLASLALSVWNKLDSRKAELTQLKVDQALLKLELSSLKELHESKLEQIHSTLEKIEDNL